MAEKTKPIRVRESVHKMVKVAAAEAGMHLQGFMEKLIFRQLAVNKKGSK